MPAITANLVKDLREKTGAGMMDCKKALAASDGDMESAIDWLRKKGLAAASKKAGRTAAEGLVAIEIDRMRGAVVEVNAETDFVARNDSFQNYVAAVAGCVLGSGRDVLDAEALAALDGAGSGRTLGEELTDLIATIGENMQLRRAAVLSVQSGSIAGYVHSSVVPGMGKIGVLVALESKASPDQLAEMGRSLAMHVAACDPRSVSRDDLDPDLVERERAVLAEQVRDSGKPEDIIAKMVEGRLRKFYEQSVLLEQPYVMDDKKSVAQALQEASQQIGMPVEITGFLRFKLGEGIEKAQENFSDEVAAVAGQK